MSRLDDLRSSGRRVLIQRRHRVGSLSPRLRGAGFFVICRQRDRAVRVTVRMTMLCYQRLQFGNFGEHDAPWKRNSPTILDIKPSEPTMTITLALLISGGAMNRPIASKPIVTHNASRNTPLISAPRISARCQPYELALDDGDVASLIVYSATMRERTSLALACPMHHSPALRT